MLIRHGKEHDIPYLLDIYNYEVANGVATFDLEYKTLEDWNQWYYLHNIENHILLVAEEDGRAVGYATFSGYREKEAYAATVELSIYIDVAYRKRGIAKKLMLEMLDLARSRKDIHTIISVITKGNEASIRLHEELGFLNCGTLKEVGEKFGRLLDIVHYQMMI